MHSGEVEVVAYDPAWTDKYATEARLLLCAIGDSVADIQHIGSTAIRGMAAKPIIDIAIAVNDLDAVSSLVQPLETLGYECRGLLAGIDGHYFFRKGDPREYFLHVFEKDSSFWKRRLAFRDYLNTHWDAAIEYQALKF